MSEERKDSGVGGTGRSGPRKPWKDLKVERKCRKIQRETDQSGGGGERLMRMTSTEGKDNQEITGGAE